MKKTLAAVVLTTGLLFGALAFAQSVVNQGKPGTQGPWPVTSSGGTVSVVFDGGFTGSVVTQPCTHLPTSNTSVGAAAAIVPAAPAAGRIWIQVCNSILNTSTAQCVCSPTTTPTFAASSVGDALATGDCALYNIGRQDAGVPQCICNGAGVRLNSVECVVP